MGFKDIEDGSAVISTGGVYQEVGLVEMDGALFIELSKGKYARLKADGSASKAKVNLEKIEYDGPLFKDRFGRLCVTGGEGRRPLIATDDGKLLDAG